MCLTNINPKVWWESVLQTDKSLLASHTFDWAGRQATCVFTITEMYAYDRLRARAEFDILSSETGERKRFKCYACSTNIMSFLSVPDRNDGLAFYAHIKVKLNEH